MKSYKYITVLTLMIVGLIANSCSSLLEENPRSQIVPSFFRTPAGLLAGIAGVYNSMRNSYGTEGFTLQQMAGTDEHLAGGSASGPQFFTYNGILPSHMNNNFNVYTDINTLNGILEIGPTSGLPEATLNQYLGQAKFLRGFLYFNLVQTFGDVPLHTTFITVPSQADERKPMADVYALIIQDLTDASTLLPDKVTAPFLGKAAAKGAAFHLLAKAYLTRGWSSAAQAGDFTQAYTIASTLITNRALYDLDLWADYADAFKPANDYGKESVLVSDHSVDTKFGLFQPGSAGGNGVNVQPWMSLMNTPGGVVGVNSTYNAQGRVQNGGGNMIMRDIQHGRPFIRIRPNIPYVLGRAFTDNVNDSRWSKTFQTVWIANWDGVSPNQANAGQYSGNGITGSRGQLICGRDTAVYFPDVAITGAPQAWGARPFKGIIVNPNAQTSNVFPYTKKFADPSRPGYNDPSTRPVVILRFAEVYLIAAEAAFKGGGTAQQAADMLNILRRRAAFRTNACANAAPPFPIGGPGCDRYVTGQTLATAQAAMTITAGQVTLDFILEERTRELFGEGYRFQDLVRTQTLLPRVTLWNPEAAPNIKVHHLLRPIPQDQIDRVVVGPKFTQNPGYN